jgi:hypothetical protein
MVVGGAMAKVYVKPGMFKTFPEGVIQDMGSTYLPNVIIRGGIRVKIREPDNMYCEIYLDSEGRAHREDGPAVTCIFFEENLSSRHWCVHGHVLKTFFGKADEKS